MKSVLILGAGGLGREVYFWAKEAGLTPVGFIDDAGPAALKDFAGYPPVVGGVDDAELIYPVICGIGATHARRACVEALQRRGAQFVSCIHPQACVLPTAKLGIGAVVAPFAYVGADSTVGDFLLLQCYGVIGHDVTAGDFLRMDTTAFIGGGAKVGHHVTLYTGAKVMPGKEMGNETTLGAGSLLLNNLSNGQTAFGSPATKL